jgi:hypothetical protein
MRKEGRKLDSQSGERESSIGQRQSRRVRVKQYGVKVK